MNWIYCKFKLTTNKNCPESLKGGCQYCKHCLGELKMIKLSNGTEISEDTVISALKKAGISVEPKHIFQAGDVATSGTTTYWRFIIQVDGKLYSVGKNGYVCGTGQDCFTENEYKFVGRQSDLLRG